MNHNFTVGNDGETAVAALLKKQGFNILAHNYRQRCGEIDLIASKDEVVCFVEVKTRRIEHFETSQVVTKAKQAKIIKTAKFFALSNKINDKVLRFDVAIVTGTRGEFNIRYLDNAFTSTTNYPY